LRCFIVAGVCLLDVRQPEVFDAAHVAGSINVAATGRGLGTRAGWVLCGDEPIVLVAGTLGEGRAAAELLRAAGVWNLAGLTVAPDPPVAVICAGGIRAALAASILRRAGHGPVSRVAGGVGDVERHGVSLARTAA